MELLRDFHGISMRLPCDLHGAHYSWDYCVQMGLSWDFHGTSMGTWWSYGAPVGIALHLYMLKGRFGCDIESFVETHFCKPREIRRSRVFRLVCDKRT